MSRKYYRYFYTEKYLGNVIDRKISVSTASGIDNVNYDIFSRERISIVSDMKKKVLSGKYKFTPYKELLILKNRDSLPRCISIPTIRDRVCLRALAELLMEYFSSIPPLTIPQKHISTIQKNIDKYDSYIKIDLKDFYGNINHKLLMSKLNKKIKSSCILELVEKAIKNPTGDSKTESSLGIGIPQGIPISNILSHIFLSDLDLKYSKKSDIMYCRYVDDILIFCNNEKLASIKKEIEEELINKDIYNLKINEKKTKSGVLKNLDRKNPLTFLGYNFFASDNYKDNTQYITSVKNEAKISIEKKIVSLLNRFKKNKGTHNKNLVIHELNRLITGSISKKIDNDVTKIKRFGWLFFYSQINDETLLWHLDRFVDKQIKNIIVENNRLKDYIGDLIRQRKTFVKTYYEIKYKFNESNYFFNPDEYDNEKMRKFLKDVLGYDEERILKMNEKEVDKKFKNYIYKKIKQDYRDLIKITESY